jgi:hypothetical protein
MRTYGTLTLAEHGQQWLLTGEPHLLLRVKRVFERVNKAAHGTIALSNTAEVCRDLEWFADRYPLAIDGASLAALTAGANRHRDHILRLEEILGPSFTPLPIDLAKPPRSYQAKEAALVLATGGTLVADDVGLGKTVTAIATFARADARPAVVVTLTHLPAQWEEKIHEFAPELIVYRPKKGTPSPLPQFMGRGPDVVILNYHKLSGWADALAPYLRTLVFDEVQELRHSGSLRYSAAQHLAAAATYRLGLSATPIYNFGGEIFNVLEVIKPGALGTFGEFSREWCVGMGNKIRLKDPKAFGSYAREQGLMIRHTRAEVGRELPPVTRIPHRIDADASALERIQGSARELAEFILSRPQTYQGEKMQAAAELDVMIRQATGVAKAPYVAEFVRLLVEAGEQVVLYGWHRAVYDIWLQKLADLQPALYTGTETAAQKVRAKDRFIAGESKVLIISLRAGAGLDGLQDVCSCVVFGELDWSPGVHEQCIGRVDRDGQQTPVVAYFLLAETGSDPAVAEINGLKREQVEGIRNPTADDLLEQLETSGEHTRRLAETYLAQIGAPIPAAAEVA